MAVKDVNVPRRRTRKPVQLGFDPALYNPSGLGARDETGAYLITDEELKKEYARLRREATERLRKLGQSEFKNTKTYKENVGKFKPIKEITDRRELERLTQKAARFVTAKGSSASGLRDIRRKQIKSLHDSGYKWVNTKNFQDFTDFMDWLKAQSLKLLWYDAERQPEDRAATKAEKRETLDRQQELFEQWRSGSGADSEEMAAEIKESARKTREKQQKKSSGTPHKKKSSKSTRSKHRAGK